MKEERKRQKQLEANFEEEYFEDHGGGDTTTCLCSCEFVCREMRPDAAAYFWTVSLDLHGRVSAAASSPGLCLRGRSTGKPKSPSL